MAVRWQSVLIKLADLDDGRIERNHTQCPRSVQRSQMRILFPNAVSLQVVAVHQGARERLQDALLNSNHLANTLRLWSAEVVVVMNDRCARREASPRFIDRLLHRLYRLAETKWRNRRFDDDRQFRGV